MKKLKSMKLIEKMHEIFEFMFGDIYIREVKFTSKDGNSKVFRLKKHDWDTLAFISKLIVLFTISLALPILNFVNGLVVIKKVLWIEIIKYLIN